MASLDNYTEDTIESAVQLISEEIGNDTDTATVSAVKLCCSARQNDVDIDIGDDPEWEEVINEVCEVRTNDSNNEEVIGIDSEYEQYLPENSKVEITAETEDLQLLEGVDEGKAKALNDNGIETVGDIINASQDELVAIDGITQGSAQLMKEDASQYVDTEDALADLVHERHSGETEAVIFQEDDFELTAGEVTDETVLAENEDVEGGLPVLANPDGRDEPHPLTPDMGDMEVHEPNLTSMGGADESFGMDEVGGESVRVVPKDQKLMPIACNILAYDNFTLGLRGEAGTGKSLFLKHLASKRNQPYLKYTMGPNTTWSDLIGHFELVTDESGNQVFKFVPGPLYRAVTKGFMIVLEEVNAAPPEVLVELNSLMESDGQITVAKRQEVIQPHKAFTLAVTMNPPVADKYRGIHELNSAFKDRLFIADVDYLPQEEEVKVIQEQVNERVGRTVIPRDEIESMVKVAHEIRDVGGGGVGGGKGANVNWPIVTTRTLIKAAQLSDTLEPKTAFKMVLNGQRGPHDEVSAEAISHWWA